MHTLLRVIPTWLRRLGGLVGRGLRDPRGVTTAEYALAYAG